MGYRERVISEVDRAFSLIKNLAVDVTLVEKAATAFAFGTGIATITTGTSKVVKGVIVEKASVDVVSNTLVMKLMCKAKDIDQPDIYDKVTISGVTWNIVPPFQNDGYTITIKVARET